MIRSAHVRRPLAVAAAAALLTTLAPAPAAADEATGELRGLVLGADGLTPRSGVVVKAANLDSETVYESARTSEDGRFALADLPTGPYELAVATREGLYPTRRVLEVSAEDVAYISVSLSPAAADEEGEDEGEDEGEETEKPAPGKKAKKSFWDNSIFATLTVVGVAGVLAVGADSWLDDDPVPKEIRVSPSSP